jgi:uncharacterized protein YfiM (DUF2279 family)
LKKIHKIFLFEILIFFHLCSFCLADDELPHFGISFIFGAASESYLHYKTNLENVEKIIYGTGLGIIPGLIKETLDGMEEDNHFSGTDMAADIAGALAGSVISNVINTAIEVDIDRRNKKTTISLVFKF